jgi:transposase
VVRRPAEAPARPTRYPLGTNLIEGINNKIRAIKRMAYGFRDDAHFFLKIRAALPGVG